MTTLQHINEKRDNEELIPEMFRLLDEGRSVNLQPRGWSMRPFIENGRDRVELVKPDALHVGDVVLARADNGHYVLHRIVGIDGEHITLLGDGNLTTEHCRRKDVGGLARAFYINGSPTPCLTTSLRWRLYSRVWMALRPVRRWLLAIYRRLPQAKKYNTPYPCE